MSAEENLIDLTAAVRAKGYSRTHFVRRAEKGELALHKIGGKWFVNRDELNAVYPDVAAVQPISLEDHIARIVAAAPPLTPETRAKIAGLLGVSVRSDAA